MKSKKRLPKKNLQKMLNKSAKSIKKVFKVQESVPKSPQQKTRTIQKLANQAAMQIN